MEPFVCRSGDYYFLVKNDEIDSLGEGRTLEAELMAEGEEPSGKRARLSVSDGRGLITLQTRPPDADWNGIEVVELVLSQMGYQRLSEYGEVIQGGLGFDLYVRMG